MLASGTGKVSSYLVIPVYLLVPIDNSKSVGHILLWFKGFFFFLDRFCSDLFQQYHVNQFVSRLISINSHVSKANHSTNPRMI